MEKNALILVQCLVELNKGIIFWGASIGIIEQYANFIMESFIKMVGARGFEPPTPTTPLWCATKLRYAPTQKTRLIASIGSRILAQSF